MRTRLKKQQLLTTHDRYCATQKETFTATKSTKHENLAVAHKQQGIATNFTSMAEYYEALNGMAIKLSATPDNGFALKEVLKWAGVPVRVLEGTGN